MSGVTCLPLVLEADLEATLDTSITKTSLVNFYNVGYLRPLVFHQAKILNSALLGKTAFCNSLTQICKYPPWKCY